MKYSLVGIIITLVFVVLVAPHALAQPQGKIP
jgi:hypothetical protein